MYVRLRRRLISAWDEVCQPVSPAGPAQRVGKILHVHVAAGRLMNEPVSPAQCVGEILHVAAAGRSLYEPVTDRCVR